MTHPTQASAPSFAAWRYPYFRAHVCTYALAMMADNVEHVISYWVVFQKFHSPALGGFAVVSHWLPFLFFSVPVGALAERVDPRRLIQLGMAMFAVVSLCWGYLFVTDTLQMWQAMVLLVLHGCSGVFWQTSSQLLLYDIVKVSDLPSAVRMMATARYLGILVGPAVGGLIMLTLGPSHGILLNATFYVPVFLWMCWAPYGPKFRDALQAPTRIAVRGLADIIRTIRDVSGIPAIAVMISLAGAASFFVGNSYHAQMPGFAHDLGHGDPGVLYSLLLAADAAGALTAGLVLEGRGLLPPHPRTALFLALGWCLSLVSFAFVSDYPVALLILFTCGFLELSFNSMAQTLVQLNAPTAMRGRVIGLFNMAALGMRAGAGLTVGLLGSAIGIHWSLSLAAGALMGVISLLFLRLRRHPHPTGSA